MLELKFPLNNKSPKPPYNISQEDNVIKSNTEAGYELVRPRFTKVRRTFELKWDIVNSEYQLIDSFFNTEAKYGSVPFNLQFKTMGAKTGDSGISFNVDVRFSEKPKFIYQGMGVWEISCSFREV